MEHMAYEAVYVYNGTGGFLGYAIRNTTDGANKLHNTNLWADTPADLADLKEQLTRLNDFTGIRSYWPDVRDPEVLAYTDDPSWEPLPLSPVEVTDDDKSVIFWIQEPDPATGFPGRMDKESSVIVMKTVMAPAPAHVQARIKKACEIVALRRMEEDRG